MIPFVMHEALTETHFDSLSLVARGKVRDIYEASSDANSDLVFVATDRISAFDHILGSGIPDKGKILTQISLFWFDLLKNIVPNHLITADVNHFPASFQPFHAQLEGRTMLVRRAKMFPVECVVRGYLSGSGWLDYQATGSICGIPLPPGLRESERLPEPLFTPAAKNNSGGHDENISFEKMVRTIGQADADKLRSLALAIYSRASNHAASRGVILSDTKFEFGLVKAEDGTSEIVLADEVLTPDSSRYWPVEGYQPGGPVPSFDKQYVRDYLESVRWNKQAPSPTLPSEIVERTREKYLQAFYSITGRKSL